MKSCFRRMLPCWIAVSLAAWSQSINGAAADDQTGRAVVCVGDVNSDLMADFAVGSPGVSGGAGRVRMYRGGPLSVTIWTYNGSAGEGAGTSLARLPDITGDGQDEVLVGGPDLNAGAGSIKILSGANGAVLSNLLMGTAGLRFGQAVANAGDVDGDGDLDFLVGVPGASSNLGRVELWSTNGGLMRTHTGSFASGSYGSAIAGGMDVTGDGRPDYVIGAPGADVGGLTNSGRVSVYSGATGALLSVDTGVSHDQLGASLAFGVGLNGDRSQRVLLVGAPRPGSAAIPVPIGAGTGSMRIYTLSSTGAAAILVFVGSNAVGSTVGDRFGTSVAAMDFDGDGLDEFCVGATQLGVPLGSAVGPGYVRVYTTSLISTQIGTSFIIRDAFPGVTLGDGFGSAIAVGRDVNGDAFPDLFAGAPFADPNGATSGRASFVHPLGPPASPVVITEVSTGEPDGVEIQNHGSTSISIDAWILRWKDSSGVYESLPLVGSLAPGGVLLLLESGATPPAETSAVIPIQYALPALSTTNGPITATLFTAALLPMDEVRLGSPNQGSLGGAFRGTIALPAGAANFHAERIWGLDSDSGADWTTGGSRTFGLTNGASGPRGSDPVPVASVLLNEIDSDDRYVEIVNAGAATVDVRRWSLRGSGAPDEPHFTLPFANGANAAMLAAGSLGVITTGFTSPPEVPLGTLALGSLSFSPGWGDLPYSMLLRDSLGRTVDLVRTTGISDQAVHHHPKAAAPWQAFLGAAERFPSFGNSIIARVPGAADTNTGADWQNSVIRTMGSANTGLVGGPGFATVLDVLVSEGTDYQPAGPGDGLAVVLNAGATHAGEKWSFFLSFVPSMGTGPFFGLGLDALSNWLTLNTTAPWFGNLDAAGHSRLDIPLGALPTGIHTENIFILQNPAGLVTGFTKVVYHDT